MVDENKHLVVFQDKKIRRVLHNGEWHFSVIDVIEALEPNFATCQKSCAKFMI